MRPFKVCHWAWGRKTDKSPFSFWNIFLYPLQMVYMVHIFMAARDIPLFWYLLHHLPFYPSSFKKSQLQCHLLRKAFPDSVLKMGCSVFCSPTKFDVWMRCRTSFILIYVTGGLITSLAPSLTSKPLEEEIMSVHLFTWCLMVQDWLNAYGCMVIMSCQG